MLAISKEQLSNMPAASYDGRIEVVQTEATAKKAMRFLMDQPVVGFDTETRPSFRKGHLHSVALMQISTPTCCFLIRLNRLGLFPELREFLENPNIKKIGLSLRDDFMVLNRLAPVEPQGFVDLQSMVKQYEIGEASLSKIHAIIFGERISKGQRLTNWEATELTELQQRYAALDAWACLRIYDYLCAGSFDPGSSPFKEEKASAE
jgi:ribonuclease D